MIPEDDIIPLLAALNKLQDPTELPNLYPITETVLSDFFRKYPHLKNKIIGGSEELCNNCDHPITIDGNIHTCNHCGNIRIF